MVKKIPIVCLLSFFLFSNSVSALTLTNGGDTGVSARVGSLPILDTGGGGGGGIIESGVRFSGLAYPNAMVTIMKNLVEVTKVRADEAGSFSLIVPEDKWHIFTLFATDTAGRKSTLLNFPIMLYAGSLTDINGIRFAPTIVSDKLAVKQFDYLTVEGGALLNTPMEIVLNGYENKSFNPYVGVGGNYKLTTPINLPQGEYLVRANYIGDTRTSRVLRLIVGTTNMLRTEVTNNRPGDCNFDQNVNIVDFSILAYWYGKSNPPACVDTNSDKKINLVDFSILAFYWNG